MRTNKWLIGGLVLSLVLNLLLVGFVAGRMSGFGRRPDSGPIQRPASSVCSGFLRDDRRAAITPELRKQMGELMPVLRKMRGDQTRGFRNADGRPVRSRGARSGARRPAHESRRRTGREPSLVRRNGEIADAGRTQVARARDAPSTAHARAWATQNGGSIRRSGCIPGAAGTSPLKKTVSDGATVRIGFAPGASSTTSPLALSTDRNRSDSGFGACEEHRERRARPALGECVTDQILDQALCVGRIPQQDQADVAFLRGRFESAGPDTGRSTP